MHGFHSNNNVITNDRVPQSSFCPAPLASNDQGGATSSAAALASLTVGDDTLFWFQRRLEKIVNWLSSRAECTKRLRQFRRSLRCTNCCVARGQAEPNQHAELFIESRPKTAISSPFRRAPESLCTTTAGPKPRPARARAPAVSTMDPIVFLPGMQNTGDSRLAAFPNKNVLRSPV